MDSAPGPQLPNSVQATQPLSAVKTVTDTRNISTYKIIAISVIFLIIASAVYYAKDYIYSEWRKLFPISELTGELEMTANATSSTPAVLNYSNVTSLPSLPSLPPLQPVTNAETTVSSVMNVLEPAKSDSFLTTAASAEQTWCLVGEDMAGRWCLQVQSPAGCEVSRTYKTKNQCERSNDPVPK